MGTLAVLTPSYAPDFELCSDLHKTSVAAPLPPLAPAAAATATRIPVRRASL